MSEFGKRLKMLREERDLTLGKLADELNTTKSNLSRYENGIVDPSLDAVINIAKYFNVTLDWIAGNGDTSKIEYTIDSSYANVLDKCIKENVSPKKLEQLIDVIRR